MTRALAITAIVASIVVVKAEVASAATFNEMAPAAQGDPYTTAAYPGVGLVPRNAVEACISAREHGGSYSRSTNPSHFGRWQFSRGLWAWAARYLEAWFRGMSARWGSAGPIEQDAAFALVVENFGYRDWAPYDGC